MAACTSLDQSTLEENKYREEGMERCHINVLIKALIRFYTVK